MDEIRELSIAEMSLVAGANGELPPSARRGR